MTTTQTDAIMALADAYAIEVAETSPPLTTLERSLAMTKIGDARIALREALLAALQARNQQGPIKTWQQRLEETCPALGPMHIHACVEEVNDAMQAEINDLRVALQEQAREGEAVAWSDDALNRAYSDGVAYGERNYRQAIATYQAEASGYKDAYFKLVESIANLKVFEPAPPIIIAAPQPAQPVALPLTPEELDLCRQWFDSIQDTNAEYLEPSDYLLAEKLYRQLNMRVPNSISEITKSGIGGGR